MTSHNDPSRSGAEDPLHAETAASTRTAGDPQLPERLGEFRILGLLGRGGMGAVYLAEQQQPAREVALKVLRGAHDDPDALRRFRLEGEALALLDHPNIAHVFATGVESRDGHAIPYIAMELVRGRTLLADAEARALDADARLRLVLAICAGVQHAHQRGVIHRDLKPGNILVDGEGRPKIMDFGIARLTDERDGSATRLTEAGQVVGTIPYMSPEQLRGETRRIDVRTDVFALGVILYELLSGRRPRELDTSSVFSAIRSAERTPMQPLAKAEPRFGGDLDTVVMKALSEEPSRRYASVAEFAADLERYLEHRPIEARAPTAMYIAGKFARRHRALVAAGAIAMVALVVATVFSLVSAQKEREARALAEDKVAVADAVNRFTLNMLRGASVFENQGRPATVTDLLEDAKRALDRDLAGQPAAQAEVALLLADAFKSLGRYDEAIVLAERACAGPDATPQQLEVVARAQLTRVSALISLDRIADAEAALTAFAAIERRLPADSASRLDFVRFRGSVLERGGRPEEARQLLEAALAQAAPDASRVALRGMRQNLALLLRDLGDLDAAQVQLDALLAESTAMHDEIQIQEDQNNLATLADRRGDLAHSEALSRTALESSERIFGRDHPSTLATLLNLLNVVVKQGHFDEADAMSKDLLQRLDAGIGRASYLGQSALNTRGYLLDDLRRDVEAEAIYREVLALMDAHPDLRGQESVGNRNNLAMLLMRLGRNEEAAQEFRRGIEEGLARVGPDHPYIAVYRNNYGECLTRLGRAREALVELRASHARLLEVFGADHERVKKSQDRIDAAEAALRG